MLKNKLFQILSWNSFSFSFLRNLFHFNILQNNVDFIINNILSNSKGMWSYVSIVGTKTYISMLSLYSIWDYYFSLFYIENCVAPSFNWTFSLYNICLEDISEGIWIVKIGMYFLGFYKVSLQYFSYSNVMFE